MAFSKRKWVLGPVAILAFLGVVYWVIGLIQYRLNVMDVENYDPRSTLRVPEHKVTRSKYPFVDVHNHQFAMPVQDLDNLVREMDSLNMAVMVNLSGFRGKYLEWALDNVKNSHPNRFVLFLNIDFEKLDDEGWPDETLKMMEEGVRQGVRGLKVYKTLGLNETDNDGKRIAIDDPRLDPIWAKCGELGIPVLIHSGEPNSFCFESTRRQNSSMPTSAGSGMIWNDSASCWTKCPMCTPSWEPCWLNWAGSLALPAPG